MDMLGAVLEGRAEDLEKMIIQNPNHVNYPIGLPFEAHGGRFFNHPSLQQCVFLQHPDQRLFDIAAALPPTSVIWVLLNHKAKGSTHPLGTDLTLHNAIKNGRAITVNSLLNGNHSDVNGIPGSSWKPLVQATFWNQPNIVRLLLDKGARVNDTAPLFNGQTATGSVTKSPLQMVLDRRADNMLNQPIRERCEKILKMLLDASADIHVPPAVDQFVPSGDLIGISPFETFLRPFQADALWYQKLSETEVDCLASFLRKGANTQELLNCYPCTSSSRNTFEHQILWHSTPAAARLFVDNADPTPNGNGTNILHEIVGCCPEAHRHPAETLRDITALVKRGADPNRIDSKGMTVLRACIRYCPSVDLVKRVEALLEAGANPNVDDGSAHPIVEAARTLEEPVLLPVVELLVARYGIRYLSLPGLHPSVGNYFPIPERPSFQDTLWYTSHNGEFELTMRELLPEDVVVTVQTAAFSVASKHYLDTISRQPRKNADGRFSERDKEEIWHIVTLRHNKRLPVHSSNLDLLMSLTLPVSTTPILANRSPQPSKPPQRFFAMFCQQETRRAAVTETSSSETPINISNSTEAPTTSRRASISSETSNQSSSSFFVPSTTQIRFLDIGRATRPGDQEKAFNSVLTHKCDSCSDGRMLTEAEYKRHEEEHLHTLSCDEVGCKRRFCVAERG